MNSTESGGCMNQPITTPANLFAFVRDALQGFLGLAVCVGTLACPTAAKADSCEAVADQAIHAVLADEDLSRPSNGGRVNLLYGLAFTSPHEFERVVRSPETSGLFRTPAIHTCERILRLLSRSFAPRPGDERELAEILARQRLKSLRCARQRPRESAVGGDGRRNGESRAHRPTHDSGSSA